MTKLRIQQENIDYQRLKGYQRAIDYIRIEEVYLIPDPRSPFSKQAREHHERIKKNSID